MDLFQGTQLLSVSFFNTMSKIAAAPTVSSGTWDSGASFDGSFPWTGADPQTLAVNATHNFVGIFCTPLSHLFAEP